MKRGKTPSLIGGGAGSVKTVTARRKRPCKRCEGDILKDDRCFEVGIPGSMGHKTYCDTCFQEILAQTEKDLDKLKNKFS